MENKLFDQLIKSRIDAMESEGKPNWKMMSAMIDQWENETQIATDSGFDSMIAEKLNQATVSFSEDSWYKFEKEFARRRTARQRIFVLQLSSAAALILFAILTFQLLPDNLNKTEIQDLAVKTSPASDFPVDQGVAFTGNDDETSANVSGSRNRYEFSDQRTQIAQTSSDQESGKFQSVNQYSKNMYSPGLSVDKMISLIHPHSSFPGYNMVNIKTHELSIVLTIVQRSAGIYNNIPDPEFEDSDQVFAVHHESQNAGIADQESNNSTTDQEPVNPAESIEGIRKPGFYLAAYTNPAFRFIQSPFDQVFNEPGYSLIRFDAGVGGIAGVNFNKVGIHGGLEYGSMDYSPRKIEEYVEDGKSIYLKNISIKNMRVPLHITYELFKNRMWEIYCKAGFTINAVLDASYEMEENANGLAYLIENLRTNPVFVNSLYSRKSFKYGILDDGELVPNVSSSADFGVGLKRQVANDIYVFVEPMIQYEISGKGFGPNHDKFHNVHLKTGLSVSLN